MAKDHGSSVKNDKQYEGLREKGMSKSRAAAISNSPGRFQQRRQEFGQQPEQSQQRQWQWRKSVTKEGCWS